MLDFGQISCLGLTSWLCWLVSILRENVKNSGDGDHDDHRLDHDDGDDDHHRLDHDDGDGDTLSASRGKRLECSFIYQAEPQGHIFFLDNQLYHFRMIC